MILEVYSRKYGKEGLKIIVDSDVVVKSKKAKKYKFCTKVGKKYIMTNWLSLKYYTTVLAYVKNKNIAFIFKYDDEYIVATMKKDENRNFNCQIVEITAGNYEVAHSKIRDNLLVTEHFIVYSNFPHESIKDEIPADGYEVFNDKLIKKYSRDLSGIIRVAILLVAGIVSLYIIYLQLYPHEKEIKKVVEKPPPPPYGLVYETDLRAALGVSANNITGFLNVDKMLKPGEEFRQYTISSGVVSGEKKSWIYRPGYRNDGDIYTIRVSGIPIAENGGKLREIPVNVKAKYLVKKCSQSLSPAGYRVSNYSSITLSVPKEAGVTYTAKIAELEYTSSVRSGVINLLRKTLETCTVVDRIDYHYDNSGVGRYEIHAKLYQKAQ